MATEIDIDALLREDEAALKEKRRNLKTGATAIDELRSVTQKVATVIDQIQANSGMSRNEIYKLYSLSRAERSAVNEAAKRATEATTEDTTASNDDVATEGVEVSTSPSFGIN